MSVYSDDQNEDDVIIEAADLTPDDMDDVGGRVEKPGYYHVQCIDVKPQNNAGQLPGKRLDLQIVDGDHKDQVGRFIYHNMNLNAWEKGPDGKERTGAFAPLSVGARKVMTRFFVNLGLINRDDVGKGAIKLPFGKLRGMQFIAKVSDDPYEKDGKMISSMKIKFADVMTLDDERARDVPKDPEALKLWNTQKGSGGGINVDDI